MWLAVVSNIISHNPVCSHILHDFQRESTLCIECGCSYYSIALPMAPLLWETLIPASGSLWMHHWYHKWQSYDVRFLRYGVWQAEFFVILDYFLSFYPPNNLENKNFEKWKKNPGDIIIFHKCTINDNHMMYGFWDMKPNRQNFFVIVDHFCPFTSLTTQKIKILKKWKHTW